jgi:hypothetical protein
MTGTSTPRPSLGDTLRLTWVADHLAHVIEISEAGETSGTWTGQACPDHGLQIGSDVDNATLLRLSGQGELADLIWEVPEEFTAEHGNVGMAALQAHLSGRLAEGERLWVQIAALWSHAWSTNYRTLGLMQHAGLPRFSRARPQRWVVASFEHHTQPARLPAPSTTLSFWR